MSATKEDMGDCKKPSFSILYLGHNYGSSRHRADALRRLGYKIDVLDPWDFFPKGRILRKFIEKIVYEMGAVSLEPYARRQLTKRLIGCRFDVIWSDQCELIGRRTAAGLKKQADFMVTYAIDDPFGLRDKRRFLLYRKSLKYYDLVVVVRQPNIDEAYSQGATAVLHVLRSADEVAHRPLDFLPADKRRWVSAITFIGTWMPERGPFLKRLIELGVPLTLYGDRWQKAREWPTLKKAWRGPYLSGDAYVKALQTSKVCLGLLSKGNRDLHTQRSTEIPYIGRVLCAERTEEHMAMFHEDKEAVFWSSPEECAKKCFALLADKSRREAIAQAGRERCLRSGYLNEPTVQKILDALEERKPLPTRCHRKSWSVLL